MLKKYYWYLCRKKRKYEQLLNLKNMNQYAVAYELFASLLIILVRVNERKLQ